MLRIILFLGVGILAAFILFIICCLIYGVIRAKNLTYQVTTLEGKVVKKEFNGDVAFKVGKKVHRIRLDGEYLVTVLIDEEEIVIDDADFYNRVECNQPVKVNRHSGYNGKGQVRHEYYEPV